MSPLVLALLALLLAAWLSTLLLVQHAIRVRVGALAERAVLAVVLSAFSTVCVVIIFNTDSGRVLFDADTARLAFRAFLIPVMLVPVVWLALYLTNRLGTGE